MASGSYSQIFSAKVYKIDYQNHTLTIQNKDKVIKCLDMQGGNRTHATTREALANEYSFCNTAHHLGVKEPVTGKKTSYLVMDRLPGEDLSDLIENHDLRRASRDTKLKLTQALLIALKEQVIDKNIVHRDIKPHNTRVELRPKLSVKIFDYGLSKWCNTDDQTFPGSLCYAAPEIFKGDTHDTPCDIFSMARTIAEIWLTPLLVMLNYPLSRSDGSSSARNAANCLNIPNEPELTALLKSMLAIDPNNRPDINTVIDEFAQILSSSAESNLSQPGIYRRITGISFFSPASEGNSSRLSNAVSTVRQFFH